ncbi:MAG: hypothetical protein ACLVIG_02015 [Sutterella wadsworthensis]
MTELRSVAVTTGEPAGIGPEVSLKAAAAVSDPILLIGDRTLGEAVYNWQRELRDRAYVEIRDSHY